MTILPAPSSALHPDTFPPSQRGTSGAAEGQRVGGEWRRAEEGGGGGQWARGEQRGTRGWHATAAHDQPCSGEIAGHSRVSESPLPNAEDSPTSLETWDVCTFPYTDTSDGYFYSHSYQWWYTFPHSDTNDGALFLTLISMMGHFSWHWCQ